MADKKASPPRWIPQRTNAGGEGSLPAAGYKFKMEFAESMHKV